MKKPEVIMEETQREAIINRPYNFAGSIKRVKRDRFNISKYKIEYSQSNTVPALMKLFMEGLDNPIDVAIKGGCDTIEVKVDSKSISIKDNGYGVASGRDVNGEYIIYKAFCKYNTSSNYKDKKGQGQKGVNGLGSKLILTLSNIFKLTNEDQNKRLKMVVTENNLNHKITELKPTGKTGVEIYFEPDFNIFEVDGIDEEHINKMYEYTLMQSLTYPNVKFKFNGKVLNIIPKQFIKLLNENSVIEERDDYFIALIPSETGDFKHLSYINGLEISKGGSHIDYLMNGLVSKLRQKLIKRYKTIKPSDIRNKLNIVVIGKNMKNIDWEGQVKDTIASSTKNIIEYFKDLDLDKLSDKVYKNKTIIDNIIDYFKIAEEFKKKQELKGMDKKVNKKPKDDKFLPPIGTWDNILLAEGDCLEENTMILDENFTPKRIKDFKEGDDIISGDGTLQKVTSFRKSLKKMNKIKTKSGTVLCSDEHRWYVYNKSKRIFEFVTTKDMKADISNYSMLKSRLNANSKALKVIKNENNVLHCDSGEITYTLNDNIMVNRGGKFLKTKATDIEADDILLFG